jgi:hypothetical protein
MQPHAAGSMLCERLTYPPPPPDLGTVPASYAACNTSDLAKKHNREPLCMCCSPRPGRHSRIYREGSAWGCTPERGCERLPTATEDASATTRAYSAHKCCWEVHWEYLPRAMRVGAANTVTKRTACQCVCVCPSKVPTATKKPRVDIPCGWCSAAGCCMLLVGHAWIVAGFPAYTYSLKLRTACLL